MANVRDLKKDINYVLGDIIEAVYIWEKIDTDNDTKKSQAIIDEAITTFDDLMAKVNAKTIDSAKAHFKAINEELETRAKGLLEKLNALAVKQS